VAAPASTSSPPGQRSPAETAGSNGAGTSRLPPHDLAAERALLGAALLSTDALEVLASTVTADDFYKPAHRLIAAALHRAHAEGWPVDPVTVAEDLARHGELDRAGGPAELVAIQGDTPATTSAARYAQIVHGAAMARAAARIGEQLHREALAGVDPHEAVRCAHQSLANLTAGAVSAERTSWAPIDLTTAAADVAPPDLLRRSDGTRLIYLGRTHWFQGESESLKSWAAQLAVSQVLHSGGNALYIDFEDDGPGVKARLRSFGTDDDVITRQFCYLHPEEPLADRHGTPTLAERDLAHVLAEKPWDLAVIDGVTEAMTTEGLDLIDNADVAAWIRRLPGRLAATGAAVIAVDHVTKDREGRGRYAIGGQHKLAGISGAAYSFDVLHPLARATGTTPRTGRVKITVRKDRPGHVRALATDDVVGILEVTSWPDGGVTASIDAPDEQTAAPDAALVLRILEYLNDYDGTSGRRVEAEVAGNGAAIREALRWCASEARGWVRIQKTGNSHLHYLTDAGRAEL
jgi:hypothetical protein